MRKYLYFLGVATLLWGCSDSDAHPSDLESGQSGLKQSCLRCLAGQECIQGVCVGEPQKDLGPQGDQKNADEGQCSDPCPHGTVCVLGACVPEDGCDVNACPPNALCINHYYCMDVMHLEGTCAEPCNADEICYRTCSDDFSRCEAAKCVLKSSCTAEGCL